MSSHARRWAGALVALTLVAGCTSHTSADPSSVPLTPGGSVIEQSSAPPSAPTSASVVPSSLGTPQGMSTVTSAPPSTAPHSSTPAPTTSRSTTPTNGSGSSSSKPGNSVPSVSVNTSGLSGQEIADRTAIEQVWVQFWKIYIAINDIPASQRPTALAPVAIEPIVGQIIASAAAFDKKAQATYGNVGHRFYWGPPVAGKSPAIMGDCLDATATGIIDRKTGQELTQGTIRENSRGVFERNSSGRWRLRTIEWLDSSC